MKNSVLKSRDITLLTKVCRVKAMVFPVVMYRFENWTIKKAEHQRMENSVEIPLKTGNRTAIWPSNPTPGHTHWGNQIWKRHVDPSVHCSTFIIVRTWKQPRCPSADKWIGKLWYIYTMEYYSAIKKNSFESVLMRWVKLEPIIQSEVSQKDKDQYNILMHIYGI